MYPRLVTMAPDGEMRIKVDAVRDGDEISSAIFTVPGVKTVTVDGEKHDDFPVYDMTRTWFWTGTGPEKSTFRSVAEIVVKSGKSTAARVFEEERDYVFSREWNRIGKTPESAVKPPVYLSYTMIPQRIDSVVLAEGAIQYRIGTPKGLMPRPPTLAKGEIRLANVYLPVGMERLSAEHLYPITERNFPHAAPVADQRLPETMRKLRGGGKLKILAWGDSITEGYGKIRNSHRWQERFAQRMRKRFPGADIELATTAWGGHRTQDFLDAPPDSPYNYDRHVLGVRPDLIVSEFHNDLDMTGELFFERYRKLLADFKAIDAEWIIVTSNWISETQNHITAVPEHIRLLREFAKENHVALADAAAHWGALWKQGIPYLTWMVNHFNHPGKNGMKLYADTLMDVFPAR